MLIEVNTDMSAMIVIEGMDNSGKSTLALSLLTKLGDDVWRIVESEGPPRSAEEINDRVRRYNELPTQTIFVRHPCVSNAIYGSFRPEGDPITENNHVAFWLRQPLIIYCDPLRRGLDGHDVKEHDTDEHLELLDQHAAELLREYRLFAAQRAHIVYRIGDDMSWAVEVMAHAAWSR